MAHDDRNMDMANMKMPFCVQPSLLVPRRLWSLNLLVQESYFSFISSSQVPLEIRNQLVQSFPIPADKVLMSSGETGRHPNINNSIKKWPLIIMSPRIPDSYLATADFSGPGTVQTRDTHTQTHIHREIELFSCGFSGIPRAGECDFSGEEG